jgi:hypothetical protein
MHKRATWIVVGFVAVVVIAATLDAALFRHHAPASTRGTTSEASDVTGRFIPLVDVVRPCARDQLELGIEQRTRPDDGPLVGIYGAELHFVKGHACSFSLRDVSVQISTPAGAGKGILRVFRAYSNQSVALGPASVGAVPHWWFFPFRYSPKCGEHAPFLALAKVGPYVASREVPVLPCGISPPPFR